MSLALAVLGLWAYRFAIPPLPAVARAALPALRLTAFFMLAWLLASPVLERARGGRAHLVVLVDRSRSMDLPVTPGGPPRAAAAAEAVAALERSWRGRAAISVMPFASRLAADSTRLESRGSTALGDALAGLAGSPEGQDVNGVVVVSDGVVNAGDDPVAAARLLGVPVHGVVIGGADPKDRAVTGVESSTEARVGRGTPVRVRLTTTEAAGTSFGVRLFDGEREIGRTTVVSPGGGEEVTAEFRATPTRPGLAVWTARVDSLAGELTSRNNSRQVAVEVAPGRLGVWIVSGGLNWDLSFVRRALASDSSLDVTTWARERDGFRAIEARRPGGPDPAEVRRQAVVVLDAIAPAEVSPAFDAALADFVRAGGAVLALGGPAPGIARLRSGRLGAELAITMTPQLPPRDAMPEPAAEARDVLAWDDDPARGDRAWRAAAPLGDRVPVDVGAGDRVLVRAAGGGPPLLFARRVGRGQVLLVNGAGLWRWSLSGHDDLTAERGRRLWRGLVHWLAQPVQGEPLRVRPERWLTAGGDVVRLFATLQDERFRPLAGARVEGEIEAGGRSQRVTFTPAATGSYVATLDELPAGRYRVTARASRGGSGLGRATTEFAVDRWSLEEARSAPDRATLEAVARASGGRVAQGADVGSWARAFETAALARAGVESVRLWENPWVFAVVVGALSLEWAWRRRRGLP